MLIKVLELQRVFTFLWHPDSLLSVDNHTVGLMLSENILAATTFETVHAKILSPLMFSLIEHQLIKVLD